MAKRIRFAGWGNEERASQNCSFPGAKMCQAKIGGMGKLKGCGGYGGDVGYERNEDIPSPISSLFSLASLPLLLTYIFHYLPRYETMLFKGLSDSYVVT